MSIYYNLFLRSRLAPWVCLQQQSEARERRKRTRRAAAVAASGETGNGRERAGADNEKYSSACRPFDRPKATCSSDRVGFS